MKNGFCYENLLIKPLRGQFFGSPKSIDNISYSEFAKQYFGFCTIKIGERVYKLSANTLSSSFLEKYSVENLNHMISREELAVIGNASWSQLHMGTKKEKWVNIKTAMKFLLFGTDERPISALDEGEVLDRLKVVMEGHLLVDGFGRAKITPLLLICDSKRRFGVWNSVSEEALYTMKLKPKSDLTSSRFVSHYEIANKALNDLKNDYSFKNLSDVDIFVWYYLAQLPKPLLSQPSTDTQFIHEPPGSSEAKTNPVMRTAIFSLMNALEFFQNAEERHRQGAIILMDQATEYVLKAKLYEVNHIKFMDSQLEKLTFEDALKDVEKYSKILEEDKIHLRKVHSARNYAQHRAVIPDSSWTREYMGWIYHFIRKFSYDNFGLKIDSMIPPNFRNGL